MFSIIVYKALEKVVVYLYRVIVLHIPAKGSVGAMVKCCGRSVDLVLGLKMLHTPGNDSV